MTRPDACTMEEAGRNGGRAPERLEIIWFLNPSDDFCRMGRESKKSKKISKRGLHKKTKSNIMWKMSAKGMKRQIAHWPVRELSRTMSANRTTAQESVMQGKQPSKPYLSTNKEEKKWPARKSASSSGLTSTASLTRLPSASSRPLAAPAPRCPARSRSRPRRKW